MTTTKATKDETSPTGQLSDKDLLSEEDYREVNKWLRVVFQCQREFDTRSSVTIAHLKVP